jgi:hypothetical protein
VRWHLSWRADPVARGLADRHYSRQTVGAEQFVPPGRCLVLRTLDGTAYWVTSWPYAEYVHHAWPGAWVCSAFRNEGAFLSSDLILDAVAATRYWFDPPPASGMLTFIDPDQVRRKRDPGRCFRKAGFVPATPNTTRGGLVALQLWPGDMPMASAADGTQLSLLGISA